MRGAQPARAGPGRGHADDHAALPWGDDPRARSASRGFLPAGVGRGGHSHHDPGRAGGGHAVVRAAGATPAGDPYVDGQQNRDAALGARWRTRRRDRHQPRRRRSGAPARHGHGIRGYGLHVRYRRRAHVELQRVRRARRQRHARHGGLCQTRGAVAVAAHGSDDAVPV
ncbi:hypothetical protein G6F59_015470 [Rhizopus arrhizus]|nr:hypothetical protein G6F59_015470 [Rhizopus arrhizus]